MTRKLLSESNGLQAALLPARPVQLLAPGRTDHPGATRPSLHVCVEAGDLAGRRELSAPNRPDAEAADLACFEGFALDLVRGELRKAGELVPVHRTPMRLLVYLVRNAARMVSKEELLEQVWEGAFVSDTAIASALKELRQVLRDDGARQRVIQTRRGSGYRFVAPVRASRDPSGRTHPASPPSHSLAVLPLESLSEEGHMDHLALGLTNALIGALARIRSLGLVSRTTVMGLRHRASCSLVHDLGRELSVDLLVAGTIDRDGPRVRVCAELLEVTSDRLLWTDHYDREVDNLLDLESDVALAVARDIQRVLPLGGA